MRTESEAASHSQQPPQSLCCGTSLWALLRAVCIISSQAARTVKNRQLPIRVSIHPDLDLHIMEPDPIFRDLQPHSFKTHAVVIAHHPLMLFAENIRQVPTDIGDER